MAVVVVTSQNTRLDDAEATTQWGDSGGGAGGALETDFFYQNANCYSRKGGAASRGIYLSDNVDSDLSGGGTYETVLWKYICTTPGLLDPISTPGMRLEIGSGSVPATESADYYFYNVQGNDTYPIDKSWLILPIDPNVISFRSGVTGSPNLTLVDYFGLRYDQSGTSKSPNQGLDAVDIGAGLTLAGGDGVSTDGVWQDFSDHDFGTVANRFGYVREIDGAPASFLVFGQMVLGTSAATVFNDTAKTLTFPDGLFAAGFSGITIDLQNATTDIDFVDSNFFGKGTKPGEDTRPTFTVTSTLGAFDATGCVFDSFSTLTLTSAATLTGCTVSNSEQIVLGGGTLDGCLFFGATTETLAGMAFIDSVYEKFETYNFDGTDWSRQGVGSDPASGAPSTLAICEMSPTRIAFVDAAQSVLETYDWDGTSWSQVGNSFTLAGGFPVLAKMTSSRIAYYDATNEDLETYDFDGTDWSLTGNPFSIAGVVSAALTDLNSSRVAYFDDTNELLEAYDFDGTDWTKTGNSFSITGAGVAGIATLDGRTVALYDGTLELLETYDFDGTDWTKTGNSFSGITGTSTPELTGIANNRISFIDSTLETMETYEWDGTDWAQVGNGLLLSGVGGAGMAFLESSQAAFIITSTLANISDCEFTFSDGHAIEIDTTGTFSYVGNTHTGYGPGSASDAGVHDNEFDTITDVDAAGETITISGDPFVTGDSVFYNAEGGTDTIGLTDGTRYWLNRSAASTYSIHLNSVDAAADTNPINLNDGSTGETHTLYSADAAIHNSSGGLVTIQVSAGGDTPSIRNSGAGSTTNVENNVALTFSGMKDNTEVRVYAAGTTTELAGIENATVGTADDREVTFSLAAGISVDVRFAHGEAADGLHYLVPPANSFGLTWPTLTTDLPVTQVLDRTFDNPA